MQKKISVKEGAKIAGTSVQYIYKLIKEKKIKTSKRSGETVIDRSGLKKFLKLNKDPSKSGQRAWAKRQKGKGPKKAAKELYEDEDEGTEEEDSIHKTLAKARIAKEAVNARIRDLEFKRLSGELIEVEKVIEINRSIDTIVKTKFSALPNRLASRILNLRSAAKAQAILEEEVNLILKELYELRNSESVNEALNKSGK